MTAALPRHAVLIPAYNAERQLGEVLERLAPFAPREDTLVVDDGSTDGTARVAERIGVRLLRQSPNQGKASALRCGFTALSEYAHVVTLDADGQHDPADLPRFLEAARTADLVVGARQMGGGMPWHRRIGNRWASWLTGSLAGQPVPDSQSGYRLHAGRLLADVVHRISATSDGYLFETEMLVRAARLGYRLAVVPIATVYGDETSHFRPGREVPRFLGLFARLSWQALNGGLGRRRSLETRPLAGGAEPEPRPAESQEESRGHSRHQR